MIRVTDAERGGERKENKRKVIKIREKRMRL